MKIDDGQWDNLSDDDAVTLLYELANNGDSASSEYVQLDSMVYERFLQTYAEPVAVKAETQAPTLVTSPLVSQTGSVPLQASPVAGNARAVIQTMDAAAAA